MSNIGIKYILILELKYYHSKYKNCYYCNTVPAHNIWYQNRFRIKLMQGKLYSFVSIPNWFWHVDSFAWLFPACPNSGCIKRGSSDQRLPCSKRATPLCTGGRQPGSHNIQHGTSQITSRRRIDIGNVSVTGWYINYSDLRVTQYSAWDLSLQ